MRIKLLLKNHSSPIIYENVKRPYMKNGFYYVITNNEIFKHPVDDIIRCEEEYDYHIKEGEQ